MSKDTVTSAPVWLTDSTCTLEDFRAHVERETDPATVPLAAEIAKNIPIYDGATLRETASQPEAALPYMAEWNTLLAEGPGILVVRGAYDDLDMIDAVTEVLKGVIAEEERSSAGSGDHFAAAGANSRIWNSHEKLCMAAPELFARYNANPVTAMVSQAWLGPLFQITMQVNVVRPGGKAQQCHRDYHMGFQSKEALVKYPARVHALSAMLTLQGGIAHCDMPLESGPTKLLPFSQTFVPGYLGAQMAEFRDYFEDHHVQLPLQKGDMLFFNPAVFHAAGDNKTEDIERFVNLMQVGSGYGRSIEIVDRTRMSATLYPVLKDMIATGTFDQAEVESIIAACAEGYPFPANLDLDSPLTGMAPESQQELMQRALSAGWAAEAFEEALIAQQGRKRSH